MVYGDRFGEVGIASRHLSAYSIKRRRFACEHHDGRRVAIAGPRFDAAAGFVTVNSGHEHVHQDACIGGGCGCLNTNLSAVGVGDLVAARLKQRTQVSTHRKAVIHDEHRIQR